jgi:hypothetical protein
MGSSNLINYLTSMCYIYIYMLNSISTSGANNRSIMSAWSICIYHHQPFLTVLGVGGGHMGIWRWWVGWVTNVREGIPRPTLFRMPSHTRLPWWGRQVEFVPQGLWGDINSPPSLGSRPPHVLFVWVGGVFFQILWSKQGKSVNALRKARQRHIKLRMC